MRPSGSDWLLSVLLFTAACLTWCGTELALALCWTLCGVPMALRNSHYFSCAPLFLKSLKETEGSLSSSAGQHFYRMEVRVCMHMLEGSMRIFRGLWRWIWYWRTRYAEKDRTDVILSITPFGCVFFEQTLLWILLSYLEQLKRSKEDAKNEAEWTLKSSMHMFIFCPSVTYWCGCFLWSPILVL